MALAVREGGLWSEMEVGGMPGPTDNPVRKGHGSHKCPTERNGRASLSGLAGT